MYASLKNFFTNVFGLDELVLFSVLAKMFQALGMVVLLLSVSLYLDDTQRGFYFSFTSIASLQVFFELGIGVVITQHAARYIVDCGGSLDFDDNSNLAAFNKIRGLFQFNLIWTNLAGLLLFITMMPLGIIFFNSVPESDSVSWFLEWLILCIGIAMFLPMSSQLSFFEGAGYLREVLKLRLFLALSSYIVAVLVLFFGYALYAVSCIFITQVAIIAIWVASNKKNILKLMFVELPTYSSFFYWFKHLLPMQSRIAIAFIFGNLSIQVSTPITLSYFGATAAGEIGLLIAITNMFIGFMGAWMATKIPIFSKLIEDGNISSLNELFNSTIKKSSLVFIVLSIVIYSFSLVYFQFTESKFTSSNTVISFLLLAALASISYAQAVYLRSFLKELFALSSFCNAAFFFMLYPLLLSNFGVIGLITCLLGAMFLSTSITTLIFINFKRKLISH